MESCEDCPVLKENGIMEDGPTKWCKEEYSCPIATTEPVSYYFSYLCTLLKLQSSGFTIDNNRLSLNEWLDLGELSSLIDDRRESNRLQKLTGYMSISLLGRIGQKR